ncbi:MAG: hypothetical protein P1V97_09940 [Planctomycetota bacterium]|nr:hypothetical protein [Planctomycetota bacterium]
MASDAQKISTSLSCEDFDALVMDYVYEDGLSANDQSKMQTHETACKPCAELASTLRETHNMALLIAPVEPRPMLNAKIIDLAQRPQSGYSFTRLVEPVGWLAAASLLLSCGYIVGLVTSSAPAKQEALAQNHSGQPARGAQVAGDVAVGTIWINHKNDNKPTEITWNSDVRWDGVSSLQCEVGQAEKSLNDFLLNGAKRDLLMSYHHLQKSRQLLKKGAKRDGPVPIDTNYKTKALQLENRIKKLAREKKLQLSGG